MSNFSIHGDPDYIDYQFQLFTFPVLVACIPLIYLIPTLLLDFKIVLTYYRTKNKDELINPNMLLVIILSQISSFCFSLSDYLIFRIPSTGIMTSWCASQEPSHFLKFLYFICMYFGYTTMVLPFVLSVLRLIPVYYPVRHSQISAKVVRYSIPMVLLYAFPFSFPLFSALGYCKQLQGPYSFGSISIFFSGVLFDVKFIYIVAPNWIFWFIACIVNHFILHRKLKKLGSQRKSLQLQRAELSVSLTSFSMSVSYVTIVTFMILYSIKPSLSLYFAAIRPFGTDFDTVLVSWIFYLTHPAFKRKPKNKVDRNSSL